ncbi:MAG: fluoride efflux transporter CrcB [Rhodothermales bacterium]|nr:fluoride efflux transporter CrcB [Rhodothermales bacterium]
MRHLLYIAAGGALGASLRYIVSMAALRLGGTGFPWGTLAVNILGSLAAGFLWSVLFETTGRGRMQAVFLIGMLGAFTTFSAFSLETLRLWESGRAGLAVANVAANNAGALAAVVAGYLLGRASLQIWGVRS